jgi:glycosyltransferase involved in cell wall biosynthesis
MSVQHVVIDDGSTDDSWDVLNKLHPDVAADCRHQANGGLSNALNRALELARGEWVVWLNADDYLLPWTLKMVNRIISERPDADMVFGDTLFVDEAGRLLRMVGQPALDRRLFERGYNTFHTPSVFWRRSLLPTGWQFDESMRLLMDLDLWLTITATAGEVVKVRGALSAFRRHERQTSGSSRPGDVDEMRLLARRHDLSALASVKSAEPSLSSKLLHGWLKLRQGVWWDEALVVRQRGLPTDWTAGADVTRLGPCGPPRTRVTGPRGRSMSASRQAARPF